MKRETILPFLTPVLYIILGIFAIVTAGNALPALCCVAGGMLIIIGAVCVLRYLSRTAAENFASNGFVLGVTLAVLGLALIVARESVSQFIPFVLGFLIALNGIRELQNTIDLWRLGLGSPWVVLIVSLAQMILGAVFMIRPSLLGELLMGALGVGLVVSGVTDLITTAVVYQKSKSAAREAVRASAEHTTEQTKPPVIDVEFSDVGPDDIIPEGEKET